MIKSLAKEHQVLDDVFDGINTHISKEEFRKFFLQKPRNLKLGIDPTCSDIHLGHIAVLERLRVFQELGHKVTIIYGSFTALVGDLTGKSQARPMLTKEQLMDNASTYNEQLNKILLPQATTYLYNDAWLDMRFSEWMTMLRNVTVSQLIQREDVKLRLKQEKPVSVLEILYPLMQGYDSVAINADVEFGGNDQWFNNMFGRQIQQIYGKPQQLVVTCPLLIGSDGTKMSKSNKNYVSLLSDNMFGEIMSLSDEITLQVVTGFIFDLPVRKRFAKLADLTGKEASQLKAEIAFYFVKRYHGFEIALQQQSLFYDPESHATTITLKDNESILDLIVRAFPDYSRSHVKRLIEQQAISIEGNTVSSKDAIITSEGCSRKRTLKVGKQVIIIVNEK